MNLVILLEKVKNIFEDLFDYHEDSVAGIVSFSIPGKDLKYCKLSLLSDILMTNNISFTSKERKYSVTESSFMIENWYEFFCTEVNFG